MAITPAEARYEEPGAVGRLDADEAEGLWYVVGISGAVSAVVGVLVLAYPDPSVKLLGVFLGINLLAVSALMIVRGVAGSDDDEMRTPALLLGTLGVIAGIIVVRNPDKSLVLLAMTFAIYLVVAGAIALGHALVRREHRWATLARGAVLVAAGALILSWPDIGLKTLALVAGIGLVLQGAFEIGEAFVLRAAGRAAARPR
jgi:uncharacterized membrane protein HdeD (DUF308 family)